jgi:hypothetical protein
MGITPLLGPADRLREAKMERLHPARRLHMRRGGMPRRYAAGASTWPPPGACFRQSVSPPRSACHSSPYARAQQDGSTARPCYWWVQRLRPAQTSTRPRAASNRCSTSRRSGVMEERNVERCRVPARTRCHPVTLGCAWASKASPRASEAPPRPRIASQSLSQCDQQSGRHRTGYQW